MGCDGPESVLEDAKVEWTEAERKDFRDKAEFEGWRSATVLDRCWPSGFFFLRQREKISEKKRGRKKGMERVNKMLSMANLRRFL